MSPDHVRVPSAAQVLEALVQFHASGIYGLRYGELKAIFRTPTNAAIAGCSSTTMSTGAILVQHFDETNVREVEGVCILFYAFCICFV